MTEAIAPISEISQPSMKELVDLVEVAETSPQASGHDGRVYLSATLQSFEETGRMGNLVIERDSPLEPTAYLILRQLENSFDEDRNETERLFAIYRDDEGKLSLSASDTVSLDATNALLDESVSFDKQIADHPDTEMVEAGKDDYRREIGDAFDMEDLQLRATLKPASAEDYETIKTLLQFGISGNLHHYKSDAEKEIDAYFLDKYPRPNKTLPRRRRAAETIRRFLFRRGS